MIRTLKQTVEANDWLTERYARRLIEERRIPFTKVGNRILIDQRDIDAYVGANRVEARC